MKCWSAEGVNYFVLFMNKSCVLMLPMVKYTINSLQFEILITRHPLSPKISKYQRSSVHLKSFRPKLWELKDFFNLVSQDTLLILRFPKTYPNPQKHPYDGLLRIENNFTEEFFGVQKRGFGFSPNNISTLANTKSSHAG